MVGSLYVDELKATMRGRFAWLGSGVLLLSVGCVATVATQDTWLDGYGIIAYFLVPLGFLPLSAVFLSSPRANPFVESVFTAPVERAGSRPKSWCSQRWRPPITRPCSR